MKLCLLHIISAGDDKMMRKKREIPVPDPNAGGLEYVCPAASWGDMTGLIPSSPVHGSENDSYADVYPFKPAYGGEAPEI